jgi:hypothetical protein
VGGVEVFVLAQTREEGLRITSRARDGSAKEGKESRRNITSSDGDQVAKEGRVEGIK